MSGDLQDPNPFIKYSVFSVPSVIIFFKPLKNMDDTELINLFLKQFDITISDIVIEEISKANPQKRKRLLNIIKEYRPNRLMINKEFVELVDKYISEGILPSHKIEDAIHAATATIFEMDAVISWNLKHLANFKKMELINGVNLKEGYFIRKDTVSP